jgi:hypothetical protein
LRIIAERVPDELFVCDVGPVQVASGHSRPTYIDLARHAQRDQVLVLIEKVDLRIGDG